MRSSLIQECFDGCTDFMVSLLEGIRQISNVTISALCLANSWCVHTLPQWSDMGLPSARAKKSPGLLLCKKSQEKTKLLLLSSREEHQGSNMRVKWPSPTFADMPSSPSQAFSGILCVCAGW